MVLVTHGASVRSFKKTIEIKWKALVLLIEFLQTFSLCCKKGSGHEHPLFRYTDLSAIYKYRLPISEAPLLVIFLQIAFVVAPGWPLRCNDCRNSKVRRSVHICMCFVCACGWHSWLWLASGCWRLLRSIQLSIKSISMKFNRLSLFIRSAYQWSMAFVSLYVSM